jgi:hypothetical protein
MEFRGEAAVKEEARVKEIEAQIADLKKRWPAHSVPANMLIQLDELEDELALAQQALAEKKKEIGQS